jgi:hypothetical protein
VTSLTRGTSGSAGAATSATRRSAACAAIDATGREEWTSLLQRFVDRTVMQAWEFPEAICPGHRVSRVVVRDDAGAPRAMAQVRSLELPLVRAGVAHVTAGPLWRRRGEPADVGDLASVLAALRDEYVDRRGLLLRVELRIGEAEGNEAVRALTSLGYARNERFRRYRTVVLDLERPLETVRAGLRPKVRKTIDASRAVLEIREGDDPELFEEVAPLCRTVAALKGFRQEVVLADWQNLAALMPPAQRPRTFLACCGGEPVGGVIVFAQGGDGATGWPVAFAVTPRGRELQAGYLLFWCAIEWLHGLGCAAFDLAGIDPDENPGGYFFKRGFGGADVTYLGTWEACDRARSRVLAQLGDPLLAARRVLADGLRQRR